MKYQLINFPKFSSDEEDRATQYQTHHTTYRTLIDLQIHIYLLYERSFPKIAYCYCQNKIDKEKLFQYFLDENIFHVSPSIILCENKSKVSVFSLMENKYVDYKCAKVYWNQLKHNLTTVEFTVQAAKKIVQKIHEENRDWLVSKKSRAVIGTIERIFDDDISILYELIQNAFDSDATKVKIGIENNDLLFYHDGNKFSEADVEAISFVNFSTKDRSYVGFMGIGFKSVFQITDNPKIHCSPFHFEFKKIDGKSKGMTLPIPIEAYELDNVYTTLIKLPIKDKRTKDKVEQELGVDKFSKKTFLHLVKEVNGKIKGISQIETPQEKFTIEKTPIEKIFRIKDDNTDELQEWLKIEHNFETTKEARENFFDKRKEKNRKNDIENGWGEATSLLIKIKNSKPVSSYKGKINVYLPTNIFTKQSFDIQGNFLIDASRKALKDAHGTWNSFLFSTLSSLVSNLLIWAKSNCNAESIRSFFKLIPKWADLDYINEQTRQNIENSFRKFLHDEAIIPIEEGRESKLKFEYLKKCVIVSKELLELFGIEVIQRHSQKKIVLIDSNIHKKIKENSNEITEWDYISFLSNKEWYKEVKTKSKQQYWNEWLVNLYQILAKKLDSVPNDERSALVQKIQECYIYPIAWKTDRKKYYKCVRKTNSTIYRVGDSQKDLPLGNFSSKFYVIHKQLEDYIRKETEQYKVDIKKVIDGIFTKLDIKRLDSPTFIRDFILPIFGKKEDLFAQKQEDILRYTVEICKNYNSNKLTKDELKSLEFYNQNDDLKAPKDLYLSAKYECIDLENFLDDSFGNFISPKYIDKYPNVKWKKFFLSIGMNDKLRNEEKKLYKGKYESALSSIWYRVRKSTIKVHDYNFSPLIEQIIRNIQVLPIDIKKRRFESFIRIINKNWNYYSEHLNIKIEYERYNDSWTYSNYLDYNSSFYNFLLDREWLPATNSDKLLKSENVLYRSDKHLEYVKRGEKVCLVEMNKDMIEKLRMRTKPYAIDIFEELKFYIKNNRTERSIYQRIYQTINEKLKEEIDIKDVRKEFAENQLIFAKNDKNPLKLFWSSKELIYNPESLTAYFPSLKSQYPEEFEDFFCQKLEIPKTNLQLAHIVSLFQNHIWKENFPMNDSNRNMIETAYRKLRDFYTSDSTNPMWSKLKKSAKVYIGDRQWVDIENSDKPIFILDGVKYNKHFEKCDKIYVVKLLKNIDDYSFLSLFNIVKASSIQPKFIYEGDKKTLCDEEIIRNNFSKLSKYIFKILDDENIEKAEHISNLRINAIHRVESIKLDFIYKEEVLFSMPRDCFLDIQTKSLYLTGKVLETYIQITEEIVEALKTQQWRKKELSEKVEKLIRGVSAVLDNSQIFEKNIVKFFHEHYPEMDLEDKKVEGNETNEEEEKKDDISKNKEESGEGNYENSTVTNVQESEESDASKSQESSKNYHRTNITSNYNNKTNKTVHPPTSNTIENQHEEVSEEQDHIPDLDLKPIPPKKQNKNRRSSGGYSASNVDKDAIGKEGELKAFEAEKIRVKKLLKANNLKFEDYEHRVEHISKQQGKAGNPWDISSIDMIEGQSELIDIRIEVKSTTTENKKFFEMSKKEFETAMNEDVPYYIYLVVNEKIKGRFLFNGEIEERLIEKEVASYRVKYYI